MVKVYLGRKEGRASTFLKALKQQQTLYKRSDGRE